MTIPVYRGTLYLRKEKAVTEMKKIGAKSKKGMDLEADLQEIIDAVEDELLVVDLEYRARFANAAILSRYHKKNDSPIGEFCYKIFQNRDSPCHETLWDCPLQEVLESGKMLTSVLFIQALILSMLYQVSLYWDRLLQSLSFHR